MAKLMPHTLLPSVDTKANISHITDVDAAIDALAIAPAATHEQEDTDTNTHCR